MLLAESVIDNSGSYAATSNASDFEPIKINSPSISVALKIAGCHPLPVPAPVGEVAREIPGREKQ